MPNIPEFDLPLAQSRLNPSDVGAGSLERAAAVTQRVGRVQQETAREEGNMVAQSYAKFGQAVAGVGGIIDDAVTQHDIANAAEQHTRLAAQAAKDLPGILANSADPVKAVQDYYDSTYSPGVEKINSSMNTKRGRMWAVEHSQSGAQAFMRSGLAEATTIQGARTISNFEHSVDNLSDLARANPHEYEDAIKQADSLMDGMKKTLSPSQQAQIELHRNTIHQKIAISAAHSLADANPEQFKADLAAGWGKGVISDQQRIALEHYANFAAHEKKIKAARGSATSIADWASNGQGGTGPDGKPLPNIWTPQGVGFALNNPNIRPEDKPEVAEFGNVGTAVELWRKQFPATGRRAAPHGSLGDEFNLEQKIDKGEAKISDITEQMKRYLQSRGLAGVNNQTAARLMGKLKPENIESFAKIHNDPNLRTAMQQAEEYMTGQSARILKGMSADDVQKFTDKGGQMEFTGVTSNPAYKAKVRDFTNYVNHTLEGAAKRHEDYRQYLDPRSDKYLFRREIIDRFLPSTPELQSGITNVTDPNAAPSFTGAKPMTKNPPPDLDKIMQGIGGPARRK